MRRCPSLTALTSRSHLKPKNITVLSCELEYQVDTKGYYQPVYMFKVMYDGIADEMRIMIPALD